MEIIHPRRDILFTAGPVVVGLGVLAVFFVPQWIVYGYYFQWLFLVLALIFMALPFGSTKFSSEKTYSFRSWFTRLSLMQFCLFTLYMGMCALQHSNFQENMKVMLIHFGLFPWGFFAFLSVAFAVYSYLQKQNVFFSTMTYPLLKSDANSWLGIYINGTAKAYSTTTLAVCFAVIALLLANLLGDNDYPLIRGFHPAVLLFIFLLAMVSLLSVFKVGFARLYQMKIPTAIICLGLTLVVAIFLLILNIIFAKETTVIATPKIVSYLLRHGEAVLWLIFSLSFWLGLAPISCAYMARISSGYTVRGLIAGLLFWPIILAVTVSVTHFNLNTILESILAIVGYSLFVVMVTHDNMLSPFVLCYLPASGQSKYRNPQFQVRKIFQLSLLLIYLFLPIGIGAVSLILFAITFPFWITLLIVLLAFKRYHTV